MPTTTITAPPLPETLTAPSTPQHFFRSVMSMPPLRSLKREMDEEADFLFNMDTEDLVADIMDEHSQLLDQDNMEQLSPYNAAMPQPSYRTSVTHPGPPAAKPATHPPSALHGQNADSSSPPTLTRPPRVKSSFNDHLSGHHEPSRQDATSVRDVKKTGSHPSRQRYRSRRSSALYDQAPSNQGSDHGTRKHHDELSHKLSDLSLHDRQQTTGEHPRRHKSSFVENCQPGRHADQAGGPSPRGRGLSQRADFADLASEPQKAHEPDFAKVADLNPYADEDSSGDWEDEDDEYEYEEVTVNRTKTASNGNEPAISTNQDLKHTSLVLAESSARMMYLCSRKLYEVMWTSQTSQRLRRSAIHTTRSASGSAANSLGRLVADTCKGSLRGVKHYVSRRCSVLKAVRRSPRDIVRLSVASALRVSRTKLGKRRFPMLGLPDREPESDIEENYDFCGDEEDGQSIDASLTSPDNYDFDDLGLPGLYEDNMYADEL